ncbi:helix-turn-helix transcriptional regulator [Pedobacter polaris]
MRYSKTSAKPLPATFPSNPQTISEHLKKRRMDLGLLQADVARRLNVCDESIGNWENGHSKPQTLLPAHHLVPGA